MYELTQDEKILVTVAILHDWVDDEIFSGFEDTGRLNEVLDQAISDVEWDDQGAGERAARRFLFLIGFTQ